MANARHFTNSGLNRVECSLGAIGALTALTAAVIVQRTTDSGTQFYCVLGGGASEQLLLYLYTDGKIGFFDGTGDAFSSFTFTAAEGWALIAFTKAAGTATGRFHKYVYGTTTWTHSAASATSGNTAAPTTAVWLGNDVAGSNAALDGDMQVAGIANTNLASVSDSAFEALGLQSNWSAWQSNIGVARWRLDQASTATAVTDDTGGGANQTALTGTSVTTGPAGFSFTASGTTIVSPVQVFGSSYAAQRAASI